MNKYQEEEKALKEARAISFFRANGLANYPRPYPNPMSHPMMLPLTEKEIIRQMLMP